MKKTFTRNDFFMTLVALAMVIIGLFVLMPVNVTWGISLTLVAVALYLLILWK